MQEEEATVGVCAKYLSLPLLMEAEGWWVLTFLLCLGHFRCHSRESQMAMVCKEAVSQDEPCDMRMNEDTEYGSEPSLTCTDL